MVYGDDSFSFYENPRSKHGKYDPTKHFKIWMGRIFAKENQDIPEHVINMIKTCIKNDNIWLENIDCNIIRRYLKTLKQTIYNTNIPLIIKKITQIEPEQLTEAESDLAYHYFKIVMNIYNTIKPPGKTNTTYYPYFIYKILEQILRGKENKIRRKKILSSIYLQSHSTVTEQDKHWQKICKQIDGFVYMPTIRYLNR
jgi:hypothetical protein